MSITNWAEHRYALADPSVIPTPALLLYEQQLRANLAGVIEMAGGTTRLRPHIKTHKCRRVVQMQRAAGIDKFKCATLAEAELLATEGVLDIVVAYQLLGPNVELLADLAAAHPQARFKVLVDHPDAVAPLARAAAARNVRIGVFIDLDVGQHRTGIAPPQAPDLYRQVAAADSLYAAGLHVYDGHNHAESLDQRNAVAAECYQSADEVRQAVAADGLEVPELIMGGSPSFPCYVRYRDAMLSPGTIFLHDAGYAGHFPDLPCEPAAVLMTRVVSVPEDNVLTLDLGYKAIAADPAGMRGLVLGLDGGNGELQVVVHNEEHWSLRLTGAVPGGAPMPRLGDVLYVIPTHICPTVALHAAMHVVAGDGVVRERWTVDARHRI